jgi:hypothetical protein
MNNIVLNSSHVLSSNNSVYSYQFKKGAISFPKGSTVALGSAIIPYSNYNVSSYLGNNQLQYSIPSSSGNITVNLTLADGFYDVDAINLALQASFKSNGFYFSNIATTGVSNPQYIWPIVLSSNYNKYGNVFTFQYIPISSGNVISQYGSNWSWNGTFSTSAQTGIITINNALFGKLIGFSLQSTVQQSYGVVAPSISNSQPYLVYSDTLLNSPATPPLLTNTNGFIFHCNLINNKLSMPSDILECMPITSKFGSNLNYTPNNLIDNLITEGQYTSINITITDQNNNPIQLQDPNILIQLVIKIAN